MKDLLRQLDRYASERYVRAFRKGPLVRSWLLHKLYPAREDVLPRHGTVNEGITVAQFEALLRYHHRRGQVFLDADDLAAGGLDPKGAYVLITFDDGYANNLLALELLAKYHAKATFHISTGHVEEGIAFWWDVLYRERIAQGVAHDAVMQEIHAWKDLRWEEQERRSREEFGPDASTPAGDQDRPLTPDELRQLAAAPGACIGDHSHRHLRLTLYSDEEVRESLRVPWHRLRALTGRVPASLAYPYGHHDDRIVRLAREAGHRVGFVYEPGHIGMDGLGEEGLMRLRRNSLTGWLDIEAQCRNLDVGFSLAHHLFTR